MARLFVLSGASIGATHDIDGTTVIGRGGDADIVLPEASVSRRHARLIPEAEAGVWKIRDLKSSNGVHVGGKRVGEARLRSGETFLLGDIELRLRDEPGEEPGDEPRGESGQAASEEPGSGDVGGAATAPPASELEFEDEIVLPMADADPPAVSPSSGPAEPEPEPGGGAADSELDSERLRAARVRAAEERSARRAAALDGPATARPRRDPAGGAGQVLQYAQHRGGDDLNQLPGWKRFALGVLAEGLAAGIAYGAFELTRTAREQAATIGD